MVKVVSFDDLVGDVEANAQSGIRFLWDIYDLVKSLKDLLLILLVNANPKILYAYDDLTKIFCDI